MSSSALPVSAALTARLVYVQSCPDCREVAHRFAAGCVADPSIASCQLIASKKNHCCESGDALVRSAHVAPAGGQLGFAQPPEHVALDPAEERRKTRDEMLRRGMIEPGQCQHGITLEFCNQCSPEPISDTNGNLGEHDLPGGFDI
jgi:hypothetical protein